MLWIKMLFPIGEYARGDVVEVADEVGRQYIAGLYAKAVPDPCPHGPVPDEDRLVEAFRAGLRIGRQHCTDHPPSRAD